MGFLRHIIGLVIALLVSSLSAAAMPMMPTQSDHAEFFPHQQVFVAEHIDVHFAARGPPLAATNVAFTGAVVAEHVNGIVMHGHETHVASLVFGFGFDAPNRTDWPELSGSLREASNSATDALAGKGPINFGMGTFNREQTLAMGEAWVGPNYRVTSKGYYESADGLRQFRPPSAKDSPFASTGVQANFEQRLTPSGAWGANGHVNVTQ